MPPWVVSLEETTFQDPWGPLGNHEHLFGLQADSNYNSGANSYAYARWCAIPIAEEAELLRIAVTPQARRQGLARKLLEISEAFLAGEGINTFYLEVRTSNRPARALYESMGWKLQRTRKAYYRDGEDAVIYQKELAALSP